MPTKPEDIQDSCYKSIWEKLQGLTYPCVVVAYGPERTYQTVYCGKHEGVFSLEKCDNAEEAWKVVDCGYVGWPGDLKVYSIPLPPDTYPERVN